MKLASAATSASAVSARRRPSAAVGMFEPLREHRERRLVEHRGHHESQPDPDRVERRQRLHLRPPDDQQHAGDRAKRHQRARRRSVQEAAHRDARGAADGERQRERARDLGVARVERVRHRREEHREGVVEDPPGDGPGDRERAEHGVRPRQAGRRRRSGRPTCRSVRASVAHATSATRSSVGDGMQHPACPAGASARNGADLQTPVSGNSSSTRSAASRSPASAAAIDRTCS